MSLRTPNNSNLAIRGIPSNRRSLSGQGTVAQPVVQPYARPADWLPIGTSTATQYIQLLVPVWEVGTNLIAFITTGATTIDWGDGTAPENVASNVQANHTYSYSAVSNLSSRGYRQAVITITPQAGQNITRFDIQRRNSSVIFSTVYATPIVDMTLKVPNITTAGNLVIGASSLTVSLANLEQVTIQSHGLTNMTNMFINCITLKSVLPFNTASVTNMTSMFQGCSQLQTVPPFNTASVTNMTSMFSGCRSLLSVPLFNTGAVTTMSNMFVNCNVLQSVPLFNTFNVTDMTAMFNGCSALETVPLFNTSKVTSMVDMFRESGITTIPLFNTAAVGSTDRMFYFAKSLKSVPAINISSSTNTRNMFADCVSLTTVEMPLNMPFVGTTLSMFHRCSSLQSVTAWITPNFNTNNMGTPFEFCTSLTKLIIGNVNFGPRFDFTGALPNLREITGVSGPVNVSNITSFGTMLNMPNLARIWMTGTNATVSFANNNLSGPAIDEIFSGLSNTGTGKTVTITGNWGTSTCTRSIATAKGWTVAG
jgi:surface protein